MKRVITATMAIAMVLAACTATMAIAMMLAACDTNQPAAESEEPSCSLEFHNKGLRGSITMPQGTVVNYTAYTELYYVENVEDSAYQYMNIYVPEGATQQTPIFMPNGIGGYKAAKAGKPEIEKASGRALAEGYVVAIAGARGNNSKKATADGQKVYTGRAPKALLDLKAAVRYLRYFDQEILGDAEKIITNGTSAGGAMSALLGTTGNHPDFEPMLKEMGAAPTRDDVYASVCFCPITDLDHADMAYEWFFGCTNGQRRQISKARAKVSYDLAALYPAYFNSLILSTPEGVALTADNYRDYIKQLIIESAQKAKDAGAVIPDTLGFLFSKPSTNGMSKKAMRPQNEAPEPPSGMHNPQAAGGFDPNNRPPMPPQEGHGQGQGQGQMPPMGGEHGPMPPMGMMGGPMMPQQMPQMPQGEYILDLNLDTFLNAVAAETTLKSAPAFDSKGVAKGKASAENEEFGDQEGNTANFTDFALQRATGVADTTVSSEMQMRVKMLNPMYYIGDASATTAQHWYIRHGSKDRDTSLPIPTSLALKLQNSGKDVDYKIAWNRNHAGDYALNELFDWIGEICK